MRIFKFGGASVKDAKSVQNVSSVLEQVGYNNTLIVISAMGKTTNKLELVIDSYFNNKSQLDYYINDLITCHGDIINDLFKDKNHKVYSAVDTLFFELKGFLSWNKSPNYSFVYDQVICYGELLSTTIISNYLNDIGLKNKWLDVRTLIKTDATYRDGKVDWDKTQKQIEKHINRNELTITQGFLGSDDNNFTTTLGREGSDYTAGIFAYCLDAENVTIWKDVPGVLNADPRHFENTTLLNQISYEEAIELAFYGASVIHPKTLQPLQRKEIPLYVKSFINPKNNGTAVSKGQLLEPFVPCYIVKKNQTLISLSSLDFSFIVEDSISKIFSLLHEYQVKVDVIQNSAISFSLCVTDKYNKLDKVLERLETNFKVSCYKNVNLYTIRHYKDDSINQIPNKNPILLKQENKGTLQIIKEA